MIKDLDEARLRLYWTWKNRRSVRHQLEQVSGRELGIDERYLYKV
jgi:hypothetical protein